MPNIQGKPLPDYVTLGFEQIDQDLRFLIECLGEVLRELGRDEIRVQQDQGEDRDEAEHAHADSRGGIARMLAAPVG